MRIEIDVNETVYREYWPPHKVDVTDLRRDIDTAMNSVERAMRTDGVTQITAKIMHYHEEVGMISVSTE